MLTFLTDEWVDAVDAAVASDGALATLMADVALSIEQHVTAGPLGDVTYHLTFDHGQASVRPGPASNPTVRFSQDYETAAAIASGAGSAQRAFMTGRLRVGGDLRVLLDHGDALAQLHDVFASVRARTAPLSAPTEKG